MTHSAFTNFLAHLRLPPGLRSDPSTPAENAAKLLSIPADVAAEVQATKQPLKLQGEVIRSHTDGSVTVQTPRGNVDLKPAEGQKPPREGQQVEIDILPARTPQKPPQNLNIRTLPDPPPPETRSSGTPVEVQIRPENSSFQAEPSRPPTPAFHAGAVSAPALPAEGAILRLQPMPPQIVKTLAPYEPLEIMSTSMVALSENQVIVILQDGQNEGVKAPQPLLATVTFPQTMSAQNAHRLLPENPPFLLMRENMAQSTPPEGVVKTLITPISEDLRYRASIAPSSSEPLQTSPLEDLLRTSTLAEPLKIANLMRLAPSIATFKDPVVTTPDAPFLSTSPKVQAFDVLLTGQTTPDVKIDDTEILAPQAIATLSPHAESEDIIASEKPLILQNQKPETLIGVVTNITPEKMPVISVFFPQTGKEQSFILQLPSDHIAVGTKIQMTPLLPALMPAHSETLMHPQVNLPLPFQLAPQPWPLIDEIMRALSHANPQTAQAFTNILPSPTNPAQLSPAILFFVAAVRGGDLTQWLGDRAIETLKNSGKNSLLSRLTQEGSNLSRLAAEPVSQDWRAVSLPLFSQNETQKIALYYRHEYEDDESEQDKNLRSTRFVFDLSLNAMGKVQLDGLYRPVSTDGQRLDLVVRTEQFFAQSTQAEMRRIYAKALRDTNITGELSFQNRPESWVTISGSAKSEIGVSA